MKLFHKFFVALLVISLVPLVVYSLILLNTTGATLRKVIDRNNINKFFLCHNSSQLVHEV